MKSLLAVLLAFGVAGGGYWWWWRPHHDEADTIAYRTAVAERGEIVQTVTATGQLSPVTTVEVGSEVSGRIAKIHVDFNDEVKTGQLLAEIDPSTLQARVFQAQAELDSANASYDLKKINAERTAELREGQLVSQADYDQAQAELKQQEAAVRIREAALQNAKLDLQRTKILAPVDGVVISRDVAVGQTVQASFQAPKLFQLAQDLRDMEISASVSEADIGGVEAGQPVTFTVDAFPNQTFEGTVRQVRAQSIVTQNVVTYATIITVRNDDLRLLPGMTASVVITTARRPNVIKLPNAALRFQPPEGAWVRTAAAAGAPGEAGEGAGLTIDQVPGLEQVPAEFRQRMFDRFDADHNGRLDATEQAALAAARTQRGGGRGGPRGAGAGGPGAGGAGNGNGAVPRRVPPATSATVYVLATPPGAGGVGTGELIPQVVRTGVTDGAYTEIVSGLEGGEAVAIGEMTPEAAAAASSQPTNPFLPAFGRGRGGPRGGGRGG